MVPNDYCQPKHQKVGGEGVLKENTLSTLSLRRLQSLYVCKKPKLRSSQIVGALLFGGIIT